LDAYEIKLDKEKLSHTIHTVLNKREVMSNRSS